MKRQFQTAIACAIALLGLTTACMMAGAREPEPITGPAVTPGPVMATRPADAPALTHVQWDDRAARAAEPWIPNPVASKWEADRHSQFSLWYDPCPLWGYPVGCWL